MGHHKNPRNINDYGGLLYMEKHRKCDLTSILTSTGIRLMGICGGSIINVGVTNK